MNANELSKTLMQMTVDGNGYKKQAIAIPVSEIEEIAIMLRQQQAEIETLKINYQNAMELACEYRNELMEKRKAKRKAQEK